MFNPIRLWCVALTGIFLSLAMVVAPTAANAQALNQQQIAAAQAQITAAINAANVAPLNTIVIDPTVQTWCNCAASTLPNTELLTVDQQACADAARLSALAKAIADVTLALVGMHGPDAASEIASIVLATAMNLNVPPTAIGAGLGAAATQLAQADQDAAILVATVLANEGTVGIANCFAANVGFQQLALIALGLPEATAAGGAIGPAGNPADDVAPVVAGTAS
jgi:hypothetical protein